MKNLIKAFLIISAIHLSSVSSSYSEMVNKIEIWNPILLDAADQASKEIESFEFDELADQIIL